MSYSLLNTASSWSVLPPLAASLAVYRYAETSFRWLSVFFLFTALIEALAKMLALRSHTNLPLYNVYLLVETLVWLSVLGVWGASVWMRRVFVVLGLIYIAGWCVRVAAMNGWEQMSNVLGVMRAIFLTLAAGLVLLELSRRPEAELFRNPRVVIASGVLVYFSINAVLFSLLGTILRSAPGAVANLWMIHSVLNIFANAFYAAGLLCISPKASSF